MHYTTPLDFHLVWAEWEFYFTGANLLCSVGPLDCCLAWVENVNVADIVIFGDMFTYRLVVDTC